MSKIILSIKNLTKIYNGKRKAVDNISFDVKEGIIFGFIGPNGAGKSTTIKMVTGLASISSGDVFICGYSIKKNFEKAIANVGGIIENPENINYMTGFQNLKYYASLYKNISKNDINRIVKLVGLQNRIHDKVSKYSLGMKQRLGIAQALLHNPKLIILDEPTNGLDINGIIEIRHLLKKLAHENHCTIIVSSHILTEMEQLCDEIAIINAGTISEIKTMQDLQKLNEENTEFYIQTAVINYAAKLLEQQFKIRSNLNNEQKLIVFKCDNVLLPQIITHLVNNKVMITGAGKFKKSLENQFIDIVNSNNSTEIK